MRRALVLLACLLAGQVPAADSSLIDVPRADGGTTPLRVYRPAAASGCAPLALISHGAGGTQNGYQYLAGALVTLGYRTVVMRHQESDREALADDMRAHGIRAGVSALVADLGAEQARLLDVGAALAWADSDCHAPFKVLLGHSMGSNTVMLEAGALDTIGLDPHLRGQNRFDAYVALSPEGPGLVFAEHAWRGVHQPLLAMTGTQDASLTGAPQTRQIPWADLPGARQCQWQGVIEGATHMNFAGAGLGHLPVEAEVQRTLGTFLQGVRAGHCTLPGSNSRLTLTAK